MKSTKTLLLAILVGTLALAGCKPAGDTEGETADPTTTAAAVTGEGEAAPAAEGEAAEPTTQPGDEAAAPEGAEAAAAAPAPPAPVVDSNFVASAESIHGSWDADFQSMLAAMSEEERGFAGALLAGAQMTFSFEADGTMKVEGTMMGQAQSETGTWATVGAEGNVLTITATGLGDAEGEEPKPVAITFLNANAFQMTDGGEGPPMTFNRKM